ncbi:hypothetical protein [Rubellimicrobium aerolatum]|uniref:Glycosyltransferase family 2 protein n=1 Tax=Rubellimicrobium aerolatum TaxID=490979 RepID=A0ABW0S9Q7_9RHOB|nr:hypothetical protein [Rubellimicrobium aerolatum]MBP1805036.1 hypothetical protein [Rubellimicrobium aerolatum]
MAEEDIVIDARWYRAAHPDVDLLEMDPAEHYERIGRLLGRRPRPEPSTLDRPLADLAIAVAALPRAAADAPPGTLGDPSSAPIIDAPAEAENQVSSVPAHGVEPWTGESLRVNGTEVARPADDEALAWPVLAAFCRLHGLDPAAACEVQAGGVARPDRLHDMAGTTPLPSPMAPRGLGDLWFSSSHGLVLSFDDPDGPGKGAAVRLFQIDPRLGDAVVQVGGQALAPQGPTFVEAVLRNPLMPLLVEVSDAGGATRELALLAFPSLARGGLHAAELAALAEGDGGMDTVWAYAAARLAERLAAGPSGQLGRLAVTIEGATGAEAIFSAEVGAWLRLFGLAPEPAQGAQPQDLSRLRAMLPSADDGAGAAQGPMLVLPADAIPTVAALTRPLDAVGGEGATLAPFVVAERVSNRPLWSVAPPRDAMEDLAGLQPGAWHPPLLAGGEGLGLPLAVVQRDTRAQSHVELLLPSSPDRPALSAPPGPGPVSGAVTCVLVVTEVAAARTFLETLAGQAERPDLRVALVAGAREAEALDETLHRLFPAAHRRLDGGRLPDAARLLDVSEGRPLLLAEDRVLLHDPRTLATLRAMLAGGRVASAACVALHEEVGRKGTTLRPESGGFFPSRIGFVGGPHLVFDQPDVLGALPRATYPVAANAFAATLVEPWALEAALPRLAAWSGPAGAPLDPLAFGLATVAEGWRHLCTSTVRVATTRPRRRADRTDPALLRAVAPARWEDLLARVTVARELR